MFRAGKLSNLEEIRETALSGIVLKMQAQIRKILTKETYKVKKAERAAKLNSRPQGPLDF